MIEEHTRKRLAEIHEPSVVKEETKEGWSCFVHHPDAGGQCERPAAMEVYGIPLCELHGMEAKAGAISELYHDATQVLERPLNPHTEPMNPVAERLLKEAAGSLESGIKEEEEALGRAYPYRADLVNADILDYEYKEPGPGPVEWHYEDRDLLHKLMRIAYLHPTGGGQPFVEVLELEREKIAAQLSYALTVHDAWAASKRGGMDEVRN